MHDQLERRVGELKAEQEKGQQADTSPRRNGDAAADGLTDGPADGR